VRRKVKPVVFYLLPGKQLDLNATNDVSHFDRWLANRFCLFLERLVCSAAVPSEPRRGWRRPADGTARGADKRWYRRAWRARAKPESAQGGAGLQHGEWQSCACHAASCNADTTPLRGLARKSGQRPANALVGFTHTLVWRRWTRLFEESKQLVVWLNKWLFGQSCWSCTALCPSQALRSRRFSAFNSPMRLTSALFRRYTASKGAIRNCSLSLFMNLADERPPMDLTETGTLCSNPRLSLSNCMPF
jgi:hypothetical protein